MARRISPGYALGRRAQRKPGQGGQLPQILPQRSCGSTPNRFPRAHHLRCENTRARPDDRPWLNAHLIPHADLTADNRVVANSDSAGQAGLGGDYNMLADAAVVANVDPIIELGTLADGRNTQRGTVHTGIGADLNIVPQFHRTDLRNFVIPATRHFEAKAICADDGSGVENRPGTDAYAVINSDARV